MEDKKMKLHITITDNETGEILKDSDTCAIIGAFNDGEYSNGMSVFACDAFDLLCALETTEEQIKLVYKNHPELTLLRAMAAERAEETIDK